MEPGIALGDQLRRVDEAHLLFTCFTVRPDTIMAMTPGYKQGQVSTLSASSLIHYGGCAMGNTKQSCGQTVLGADVALDKFDAGIAGPESHEDLRSIKVRTFPRTPEGARQCLEWIDQAGGIDSIVMETTGYYSRELAAWFRQHRPGLPVFIANAYQIKRFGESLGSRTKTDAQDARVIACYGVGRRLWLPHEKSEAMKELNSLHKDRTALVIMLKSERMRAFGAERNPLAIGVHEKLCQHLQAGIDELDEAIRKVVAEQKPLKVLGLRLSESNLPDLSKSEARQGGF